ncbi:MAG: 4-hydroxythreonine-4-phosphate dehydrogenase PdxA [Myxococcota bacterium]
MNRPLVVTPGDPHGIGPEVAVKALRDEAFDAVLVGDRAAIADWADRAGLSWYEAKSVTESGSGVAIIEPEGVEAVEVRALRFAVEACLDGSARGLVTGPIHKARLAAQGFRHPGHTEFLGELCGVERPVMAFVGGRVRVALVTVHLPLSQVPRRLTSPLVRHTIEQAGRACVDQLGIEKPRLAVCGLNPHAGDDGLLGHEDQAIIAPAVAEMRGAWDVFGPVSAENAFRAAVLGNTDLVVAMYHDQGLAPLKALEWARRDPLERAVNWTLGLPIVRTSVDHGTADDIAGQGIADAASMRAAMRFADRLTQV